MRRKLLSILALLLMTAIGAQADESGKKIYTMDFSTAGSYTFWSSIPAGGSVGIADGALCIYNPAVQTNIYDLQLEIGTNITTKTGYTYIIKVEYKTTAAGSVLVALDDMSSHYGVEDWNGLPITVSGDYQTFVTEIKNWGYGVSNTRILWQFGKLAATIHIKKVEVYECKTLTANSDGAATPSYWATYYSTAEGFMADANTTVFQAALSGTTLTLTAVPNREIPASKAVILKSSAANITLTPATTTETLAGNVLVGTTAEMNGSAGNIYVLNKGTNGVGFYKLNAAGTLAAGKAYLVGPTSAPELDYLEFTFDNGNTTGVNDVRGKMSDVRGEYYNLSGQRVVNPTKGLYIVNGKKVIIK